MTRSLLEGYFLLLVKSKTWQILPKVKGKKIGTEYEIYSTFRFFIIISCYRPLEKDLGTRTYLGRRLKRNSMRKVVAAGLWEATGAWIYCNSPHSNHRQWPQRVYVHQSSHPIASLIALGPANYRPLLAMADLVLCTFTFYSSQIVLHRVDWVTGVKSLNRIHFKAMSKLSIGS